MKKFLIFLFAILATNLGIAQLRVVSIEKVNLPNQVTSYNPKFSPDGKSIYFSNGSFSGIWRYDITDKFTQQITNDPFSGFGFDISPQSDKIVYRRSIYDGPNRTQDVIEKSVKDNSSTIIESGPTISTPIYFNEKVVTSKNSVSMTMVQEGVDIVKVLGIEGENIAILKNGKKEILDPLGNGKYIWPSLSPDGQTIVAVDMDRGAFLCTIDGTLIRMLGKRNAPAFTHDGKWIIYMVDIDDGHQLLDSDIFAVSVDGRNTVRLTNDKKINLNPAPSTIANKIAFSTADGELFILNYEETR